MSVPKVVLISLGGTIAMTRGATGGIAPTLTAADIVNAVPGIARVAAIEAISAKTVPGASLTIDDVIAVAALADEHLAQGAAGVVVVQGTDTIEETAFVLDLVIRSDKPVVITGAMRGPEAAGADGPANVLAATIVAAASEAAGLGALVVLNDEIHSARFAQKSHTVLPSAFASPLAGPLGLVIEGRPRIHLRPPLRHPPLVDLSPGDAPVALVSMSLGDDGRLLQQVERLGYRGLVVEGMGAGHVPSIVAPIIGELARRMPVVLATRVHTGPTLTATYGFPGSETDLIRRGAIPARDLSALKARLLLSLLLRTKADPHAVAAGFVARAS